MAIYHYSIKIIKRSTGRSAVAAAAYRSGEKLINKWDGTTHDYTKKGGIIHSEIMLPDHAPEVLHNRSLLWNSVEQAEKASNAQLAREIDVALPIELGRQEQLALIRRYVKNTFVEAGMCADFAIHDRGDGNPHAHIMLTLRPLQKDGSWGAKCRKEYDLDERGQRIRLPSGEYKSHRVNTTDWNDRGKAEEWRSAWAEYANRALEQKGISERIDHRSYERQGIEKLPTIHMGVAASQMERRGIITEKGNINREIAAQNQLLKEIKARLTRLHHWTKEQAARQEGMDNTTPILPVHQTTDKPTTLYGKVKALKDSATMFNFLQSHGITSMQELHDRVNVMQKSYYDLRGEIKGMERQISALTEHLKNWQQYEENKAVHKQMATVKPRKLDVFMEAYRAELALFDAAVRYLNDLKKSGEAITPKKWKVELATLTSHKHKRYEQMKVMREEIKVVEKIRKDTEQVTRIEPTKHHHLDNER